jgi:hypothetical protein
MQPKYPIRRMCLVRRMANATLRQMSRVGPKAKPPSRLPSHGAELFPGWLGQAPVKRKGKKHAGFATICVVMLCTRQSLTDCGQGGKRVVLCRITHSAALPTTHLAVVCSRLATGVFTLEMRKTDPTIGENPNLPIPTGS